MAVYTTLSKNVTIEDLKVKNAAMWGVGTIDGVKFEHVIVDGAKYDWASPISGTQLPDGSVHKLKNISFYDVHVRVRARRSDRVLRPVPRSEPLGEHAGVRRLRAPRRRCVIQGQYERRDAAGFA